MPLLAFDDPGDRTLGAILRRQAERRPDTPFIITDAATLSYGESDRMVDRCAAGLHQLGIGPGDTVAFLAETSAELVIATFAVNRLGAIWVPTNTEYRGDWLHDTLVASRARVLVIDHDLLPHFTALPDPVAFEHLVILGTTDTTPPSAIRFPDLLANDAPHPAPPVSCADTAAVLWTSGTTGRAKGVMQSHNAWVRAALSGARTSQTNDDDVLYCCLPLYNSAGWIGVIYRALVAGVPVALDRRFSVAHFWDRVRHFGATQSFTLGSMHIFLWQAAPRPDDAVNPLRCLGAIPMPDQILEPFKRRFGIDIIQQGYGQSEIMGLISRADDGSRKWNPGAAGTPLPGIEVRLLGDDDREVPVGEAGEFCVRPVEPSVMFNGYFNDPEATLRACRNLWYHTGDLGRVDEDGQYHFVDRKADYIRFKGRSVSSFAVEAALRSHPAVGEVAAFGVSTVALVTEAEIMVAVVRRADSAVSAEELARHVNDTAPYFLVPRFVELVDELPLTPTGKVQKRLLRERGVTPATWDREAAGFELRR